MIHVVLDIETMGLAPGSAVMSIGAVSLGGSEFSVVIEGPSGSASTSTARWWMRQREEVRDSIQGGVVETEALRAFAEWLGTLRAIHGGVLRLWGSEDFDTVILAAAYARNGIDRPWHYQEPRGLRTILEARGVDEDALPWEGIEHIAIECARHAAAALKLAIAEA